ncbi:MAG TPA: thioredoxin domain-containing protein [Saprospiraceae bacterium]|nr:thioredoxin domain-containing protein [Saprospiraceae bacterium]HMQ81865.1 thioredoxin domain-containing protein [Saprospiraceae bacterium]
MENLSLEALLDLSLKKPIVAYFIVEWLGMCFVLDTYMKEMEASWQEQVSFHRFDTDLLDDWKDKFSIQNLPTTLLIRNGEIVYQFEGVRSKSLIESNIRDYLG